MDRNIYAIRKANGDHDNPHEAISAYAFIDPISGAKYYDIRENFVKWILQGNRAYVLDGSTRVNCYVNTSARGNKFLQTYANGKYSDNLLRLPEF